MRLLALRCILYSINAIPFMNKNNCNISIYKTYDIVVVIRVLTFLLKLTPTSLCKLCIIAHSLKHSLRDFLFYYINMSYQRVRQGKISKKQTSNLVT